MLSKASSLLLCQRCCQRRLSSSLGATSSISSLKPSLDLQALAAHSERLALNAALRGMPVDMPALLRLLEKWRSASAACEALRAERKALASGGSAGSAAAVERGRRVKKELAEAEEAASSARSALEQAALALPSATHPQSPIGPEEAAVTLASIGSPRHFSFAPRDHVELGSALGLFDLEAAARTSGSGFVTLTGDGVKLELALVQWALSRLSAAGFGISAPPDLALRSLVEGCGFSPRGGEPAGQAAGPAAAEAQLPGGTASQVYSVADSELCLVGTAEIPLAGSQAGCLLAPSAVARPLLTAAWSHCFRREAGGGGSASRGLYRLHQFTKVEMFAFVAPRSAATLQLCSSLAAGSGATFSFPELARKLLPAAAAPASSSSSSSTAAEAPLQQLEPAVEAVFARLVDLQCSMVAELGLHARVLDMPTEELGAAAFRKVDIEAWMPGRRTAAPAAAAAAASAAAAAASASAASSSSSPAPQQGTFGEISSASNCSDFQARRLGLRYRLSAKPGDTGFLHTLNATAAAVPRLIIALLETHQRQDGSVDLPSCLWPFMGGQQELRAPASEAAPGAAVPASAAAADRASSFMGLSIAGGAAAPQAAS
jgi:seryl-tRNA synthetase